MNKERYSHRYARFDDLPEVYAMYLQALGELEEKFNEEMAFEYVLKNWTEAPCILLEEEGEIIGFVGLSIVFVGYADDLKIRDYMFFVRPERRSIKGLLTLCRAAQDVSKEYGKDLYIEYIFTDKYQKQLRLMRMADFKPIGIMGMFRGGK